MLFSDIDISLHFTGFESTVSVHFTEKHLVVAVDPN